MVWEYCNDGVDDVDDEDDVDHEDNNVVGVSFVNNGDDDGGDDDDGDDDEDNRCVDEGWCILAILFLIAMGICFWIHI